MKTLLISDLHLGFKYSRAQDILQVLDNVKYDRLILNGDIFDISNMLVKAYWDEHHTRVLKKILKIARNKEVIYVIGNHDYPLMHLEEYTDKLAGIHLVREYVYTSGDKTILCLHGDQLDCTSHRLQLVGDLAYRTGLWLNRYVNIVLRSLGYDYWSISKWGKDLVKNFIARAFNINERADEFREKHQADVLVYGHTHMPYVTDTRVNTGTFVEIATYVLERDGEFTLYDLDKNPGPARIKE